MSTQQDRRNDETVTAARRRLKKAKGMATLRYGFALALVLIRQKASISQYDVASNAGVTQRKVSDWETGKRSPPVSMLPTIAKGYQTTISRILKILVEECLIADS